MSLPTELDCPDCGEPVNLALDSLPDADKEVICPECGTAGWVVRIPIPPYWEIMQEPGETPPEPIGTQELWESESARRR